MELLNPLALWLIPLVAVLLWLNSRRPRDRRSVGNLYLWQQAAVQAPARLRFRRTWRHWLLALQIAFMLAAIVALAGPAVSWRGARTAFVFDLSAGMAARSDGRTRLDLAKERARTTLAALGGRVRIVSAQSTAIDRGEFGASDDRAKDAIGAQTATAGASALADGIRLARLAGNADAVYVFSDRGEPRPPIDGVRWIQVGAAGENVAITSLSARQTPAQRSAEGPGRTGPRDGEVLIGLQNFGTRSRELTLELRQNDVVVATEPVRLEAGVARTVLTHVPGIAGVLTASIANGDDLDVDNRRLLVAPPSAPLRVLLRTAGNLYLEQALASIPAVQLETIAPAATASGGDYDVVVCDGCAALPPETAGVLWLRPTDSPAADRALPLVVAETGHAVARSLELGEVSAGLASNAAVPPGAAVVVRAGGRPAVVAYEETGRRVVDLRIALRGSDLPLSVGFPVLVANATDWLAARNRNEPTLVAGEPLRWTVAAGTPASTVRVLGPDGRERTVAIENGNLTFADTSQAGVYVVRGLGPERSFVVNAAATESDLSIRPFDAPRPIALPGPTRPRSLDASVWFIALALALLAAEWWVFRKRSPASRAFVGRAVTAIILLLAAAGIGLPTRDGSLDVMFVLDRSDSISPRGEINALAGVRRMTERMRASDRAGLVVFGLDAAVERGIAAGFRAGDVSSKVNASGTNIEHAIDLARASLPDPARARIVLVSDGRETAGAALNAAARAAADGTRVDAAGVETASPGRTRVTNISAPADAQVGEPFAIRVDIEGRAGASERVVLYRDAEAAGSQAVVVPADGSASVTFDDTRSLDGTYSYTAAIESDDDDVRAVGRVVAVSGVPVILYVGPADGIARPLEGAGYRVQRAGTDGLPGDVSALRRFAAVVLDHVAPDRVTAGQSAALGAFVEETGGGLLVLGDAQTLDAGGYAAGPLGRLLPVDFRPRAGRRDPAIGLVVVFDKSGSMADRADGIPKIEIAREAAKKAFDVVPPGDSLGVIAFDATPTVAVPFGPAREARTIVEQLRAVQPGGSTAIAPAVGMAVDWLRAANVARRYILLVSDGRTSPADADRVRATMRGAGVELSVVAIGADADRPFLRTLAESSGGRAYFPDDARVLPSIVAREATRAAGGSIVAESFVLRAGAHPVLAGISPTTLPAMSGYVVGAVKPGAAAALSSHLDDPILAGWQTGLGRVAVFTSDLSSEWTSAFHRWPAYGALWAQTARWLGRRSSDAMLTAEVVESAGSASLVVNAERPDGRAVNLAGARVDMRTPSGENRAVDLRPRRPGRYEAPIPATDSGTYILSVEARDDSGIDARIVRGFYWSADRERRATGLDRATLAQLAAATGGRVLGPSDSPFDGERPRGSYPLRRPLLVAALIAFLVDIGTRRGVRLTRGRPGAAPSKAAA